MLFTSYRFLLFALIVFALYYLLPRRWQWGILLTADIVFYAVAGPYHLLFVLGSALTAYGCALRMAAEDTGAGEDASPREKSARKKKRWVALTVLLHLALLMAVRCLKVFSSGVVMFGVSYYSLQAIGYVTDVYRGQSAPERNPFRLLLFLSFFPLSLQGPICRYHQAGETLFSPHAFDARMTGYGLARVLYGFFKKLVIADRLRMPLQAMTGAPAAYGGYAVLFVMLLYAVQLYADFTGGIDIAVGLARMFGITLPENFRRPYGATTLGTFWNRWHMTMGQWFRDYVFYPVSTSAWMARLMQRVRTGGDMRENKALLRRVPVYTATLITWCLTGLWHGIGWSYLVWGLMNGVALLIGREITQKRQGRRALPVWLQTGRTMLIVATLRLFDCYRSVPLTFRMAASVLSPAAWRAGLAGDRLLPGLTAADAVVVCVALGIVGVISHIRARCEAEQTDVCRWFTGKSYAMRAFLCAAMFFAVLIFGVYGRGYDAAQFIYTRF